MHQAPVNQSSGDPGSGLHLERGALVTIVRIALVDDGVSGLYDRGRDEMRAIGVSLPSTAELVAALAVRARAARPRRS